MRSTWNWLQRLPFWYRWPIKASAFAVVVFLVLYPNPAVFIRHIRHIRMLDALADPEDAALEPIAQRLDSFLTADKTDTSDSSAMLAAVETFVHHEIPYAWDWETWGAADYLPSLPELLARGQEDCDGRALLAAALLRRCGVQAQLVGDPRHYWVSTPEGDTMRPLGEPSFRADAEGLHVRWSRLIDLGPVAYGISVFPLSRELVILLTGYMLLLPASPKPLRSGLALALMLAGLALVRLGGADPVGPRYALIAPGLLGLATAALALSVKRRRVGRGGDIPTGRSVEAEKVQ